MAENAVANLPLNDRHSKSRLSSQPNPSPTSLAELRLILEPARWREALGGHSDRAAPNTPENLIRVRQAAHSLRELTRKAVSEVALEVYRKSILDASECLNIAYRTMTVWNPEASGGREPPDSSNDRTLAEPVAPAISALALLGEGSRPPLAAEVPVYEHVVEFLRRLSIQMDQLREWTRLGRSLHALVQHVLAEKSGPEYDAVLDLASSLIEEVDKGTDSNARLIPIIGLKHLSSELVSPQAALVWGLGIASAETIAKYRHRFWLSADTALHLVAASLLHDIGWLQIDLIRSHSDIPLKTARRHAAISSAMAMRLRRIRPEVGGWISHHHEHMDGSGSPRGLSASELTQFDRLLGCVTRFEELRQSNSRESDLLEPQGALDSQAANQLSEEAISGRLDPHWTRELLNALGLHDECARIPEPRLVFDPSLPPLSLKFDKWLQSGKPIVPRPRSLDRVRRRVLSAGNTENNR